MSKPQRKDVKADNPEYDDYPDFKPDLSPLQMAKLGAFGGSYFNGASNDDLKGIPENIIELQSHRKNKNNNMFGVNSGMSLEQWQERGWIREQDPLGWYHWYIRFHSGRRTGDDERQISRWKDFVQRWTPKSREALNNMDPGPGSRQALLHWAVHPWKPEISIEKDEAQQKKAA